MIGSDREIIFWGIFYAKNILSQNNVFRKLITMELSEILTGIMQMSLTFCELVSYMIIYNYGKLH